MGMKIPAILQRGSILGFSKSRIGHHRIAHPGEPAALPSGRPARAVLDLDPRSDPDAASTAIPLVPLAPAGRSSGVGAAGESVGPVLGGYCSG